MGNRLNRIDSSLLKEVGDKLDEDKVNTRTGMQLMVRMMLSMCESTNSIMEYMDEQNGRVAKNETHIAELQKKNIVDWISTNKSKAFIIFIAVFVVNASINWQGIRQPIIKALFHSIGVDVPIEAIP